MKKNAIPHHPNAADMYTCRAFVEASTLLQKVCPGYSSIMASEVTVICTPFVDTAETDGYYVYINPTFFLGLPTVSQRAFLLGHESAHCALKHPVRGSAFARKGAGPDGRPFNHYWYNYSADCVINRDLIDAGLEMIPGGCLEDRFTRDDVVDAVYVTLMNEQPEPPTGDPGEDGKPSDDDSDDDNDVGDGETAEAGDDDDDRDGQTGTSGDDDSDGDSGDSEASDDDAKAGIDDHLEPKYSGSDQDTQRAEDEAATERAVDRAIEVQEDAVKQREVRRNQKPNANMVAAGRAESQAAKAEWRSELAEDFYCAGRSGTADPARIHRRRFSTIGVISPATRGTLNSLVLTIDISWSVDRDRLNAFIAECAAAIDVLQPADGVTVVWCNHLVERVDTVFSGGELLDLDVPGGGGTDLTESVKWLEEQGIEADIHLCFTDGEYPRRDWADLGKAGVITVMDRPLDSYHQRIVAETGQRVIVAVDA
jgi:predicted metal-dependent peptidase